jgi:hypothetical protein
MMMAIMLTKTYSHTLHESSLEDHNNGTTNSREAYIISGWKYFSLGTALTCSSYYTNIRILVNSNRKETAMKLMSHFVQ